MHVICDGIRYNDNNRNFRIDNDEDEVYVVLDTVIIPFSESMCSINHYIIPIKTAYFCSLIDKTIRYVDNDIYVPVRKFIMSSSFTHSFNSVVEAQYYLSSFFTKDIKKFITYTLIDAVCEHIDNDNVKQYFFDNQTLLITEISTKDIKSVDCIFHTYSFETITPASLFQYSI